MVIGLGAAKAWMYFKASSILNHIVVSEFGLTDSSSRVISTDVVMTEEKLQVRYKILCKPNCGIFMPKFGRHVGLKSR